MPQPALHVLIAHDLLDGWRRSPERAPFDIRTPDAANHFMHGSLAPDMGFFPGGDGAASTLVHAGGAVAVARRLLASAKTDADRAFAWGWIAHILADVEVHPIIEAAADAALRGSRAAATPATRMLAHIRLEVGLDAWHLRYRTALRGLRLRHALDARRIGWLREALTTVYGDRFTNERLLASHRGVTRWYHAYLILLGWIAAEHGAGRDIAAARVMNVLRAGTRRLVPPHSPVHGFVRAARPVPGLLARVHAAVTRTAASFALHAASDLVWLPEFDLETGRLTGAPTREAVRTTQIVVPA